MSDRLTMEQLVAVYDAARRARQRYESEEGETIHDYEATSWAMWNDLRKALDATEESSS